MEWGRCVTLMRVYKCEVLVDWTTYGLGTVGIAIHGQTL